MPFATCQSNLNFQFDPKITSSNQPEREHRFENVTAQEALLAVLENHNLALVKEPKQKIARITFKDPKAEDPLFTRIIQLGNSDPTNLIAIVKGTLSPRSSVVADTRTSQLIVTTTEKEMDALALTIEKLDTPTKQVLIEAKLVETARAPARSKGLTGRARSKIRRLPWVTTHCRARIRWSTRRRSLMPMAIWSRCREVRLYRGHPERSQIAYEHSGSFFSPSTAFERGWRERRALVPEQGH